MSIALASAGFVVFGLYGVYHLRTELGLRRQVVERNTMLLGRSLQVSIENALRDKQMEDIRETIRALWKIDPSVDVQVWSRAGQVFASSGEAPDFDPLEREVLSQAQHTGQAVMRYDLPDNPSRLLLALSLRSPGGKQAGALLLNRPLTYLRRDLRATRRDIELSVLFFILATTAIGHILGRLYIGRPLNQMAGAMRRVRSGDLSLTLETEAHDEVSAVALEFNEMVGELRDARRRLEDEVEQKRRLERGLQEAGKLITIGQLSAGLAHEIGSPLQILNGRARALLSRAHDPEATRRNAEILVSQTDRITRIVEQLLQFARRRPARITRFDLMQTATAVVGLLEIEARRRRLSLSISGGEELPQVEADEDQVQQIVLNLVTNALLATPAGGQVSVRLGKGTLQALDGREISSVRLEVSDTGCGIAEEVLPRLGEPFFTTRASEGGTGLGLAVVKAIINAHRGNITVESRVAEGSRFCVDLPVRNAPEPQELAT